MLNETWADRKHKEIYTSKKNENIKIKFQIFI